MRQAGNSQAQTTRDLDRVPSTISRELNRNATTDCVYEHAGAQRQAMQRRANRRSGDGLFEDYSFWREAIEMRRADVGITAKAESLTAMLINKDPDEVRRGGLLTRSILASAPRGASTSSVDSPRRRGGHGGESAKHTKYTKTEAGLRCPGAHGNGIRRRGIWSWISS